MSRCIALLCVATMYADRVDDISAALHWTGRDDYHGRIGTILKVGCQLADDMEIS